MRPSSPLLLSSLFLLTFLLLLPSTLSQCTSSNVTSNNFGRLFQGANYEVGFSNVLQLSNLTVPLALNLQGGYITALEVYIASFAYQGSFRLALYTQSAATNNSITLFTSSPVVSIQGNTTLQIASVPLTPVFLPPSPGAVLVAIWFADNNLAVATDNTQTGSTGTSTLNYTFTATGSFPPVVANGLNPIGLLLYNLQVGYSVSVGAGCFPKSSTGVGRVSGDPQFIGFLGQSFQVHGVDGYVYNVISSAALQLNARFTFLEEGRCPVLNGVPQDNCWSHPGSYLGEVGVMVKVQGGKVHRVQAVSGDAKQGFASVQLDGVALRVGAKGQLGGEGGLSYEWVGSHELKVKTPQFSFIFYNSDRFLNQQVSLNVPMKELTSHGLLGQTHTQRAHIEGDVDEYVLTEGDVWGTDFRFNQFHI